jgi:two-component system chemotaxis response regulator CheY
MNTSQHQCLSPSAGKFHLRKRKSGGMIENQRKKIHLRGSQGGFMKVLLVDDSEVTRRIYGNRLIAIGVTEFFQAENGKEGLVVLKEHMPIDFILLDWNMPEMNGYDFLVKVRSMPEYKNVKIIMCTSESEKNVVIEALKAGANGYLVKPFASEALQEKLGVWQKTPVS